MLFSSGNSNEQYTFRLGKENSKSLKFKQFYNEYGLLESNDIY